MSEALVNVLVNTVMLVLAFVLAYHLIFRRMIREAYERGRQDEAMKRSMTAVMFSLN